MKILKRTTAVFVIQTMVFLPGPASAQTVSPHSEETVHHLRTQQVAAGSGLDALAASLQNWATPVDSAAGGLEEALQLDEVLQFAIPGDDSYAPHRLEAAAPTGLQATKAPVTVVENPTVASGLQHMGFEVHHVDDANDFDPDAAGTTGAVVFSDQLTVTGTPLEDFATLPTVTFTDTDSVVNISGYLASHNVEMAQTTTVAEINPQAVVSDLKDDKMVVVHAPIDRIAEKSLWSKEAHGDELKWLYGRQYDIMEGKFDAGTTNINRIIADLDHESQAVSDAAADVIVKVRAYNLTEVFEQLAARYAEVSTSFERDYHEWSWNRAVTAIIEPVFKTDLGSPYVSTFAGEMTPDRKKALHKSVNVLAAHPKGVAFSGSGQRGTVAKAAVDAALQEDADGNANGFGTLETQNDIGSVPHDSMKVLYAVVARLFVRQLPYWWKTFQSDQPYPGDAAAVKIITNQDPRANGASLAQVAMRIFRREGVEIEFSGVAGAPEAANRALMAPDEENVVASWFQSPSHINVANSGTKLMMWLGQILPWKMAEEFNTLIMDSLKDEGFVSQTIDMLAPDAAIDADIEKALRDMPQSFAQSKAYYHEYLLRALVNNFDADAVASGQLADDVAKLRGELDGADSGQDKVVLIYDANGGSGGPGDDVAVFKQVVPTVVINPNAQQFAHQLPPGLLAATSMVDVANALKDELQANNMAPVLVGPDTDRDRKTMVIYNPDTEQYEVLDAQVGFVLDVLDHVMAEIEADNKKIAVVHNGPTTVLVQKVIEKLSQNEQLKEQGFEFRLVVTETGEANVVQGMLDLQEEGFKVIGGEGSAAAAISGIMVRDMVRGVTSAFSFMRNQTRTRKLIELMAENDEHRQQLTGRVDGWYEQGQLSSLMYRIINEVMPPTLSRDPNNDTEAHHGVGLINQKPFKDALDQVLDPDQGNFAGTIQEVTAGSLSRALDRTVNPNEIVVSPPINREEEKEKKGAGNRDTHDGGWEVQVWHRTPDGDNLLYKLWIRLSKTEVGKTRRLLLQVGSILPPEQRDEANAYLQDLDDHLWPQFLAFLNRAESQSIRNHLEGAYGPVTLETIQLLNQSTKQWIDGTRDNRSDYVKKFIEGDADSPIDVQNLREMDARVEGAVGALRAAIGATEAVHTNIFSFANAEAGTVSGDQTQTFHQQAAEILAALDTIDYQSPEITERADTGHRLAWDETLDAFRWKLQRLLDIGVAAGDEINDVSQIAQLEQRGLQFSAVFDELRTFANTGTAVEDAENGVANANLVIATILLSQETDITHGLTQQASLPATAPDLSLSTQVYNTPTQIGVVQAEQIIAGLREARRLDQNYTIGLATGSTPQPVLEALATQLNAVTGDERLDFLGRLHIVMMDDAVVAATGKNVSARNALSAKRFLDDHLFSKINLPTGLSSTWLRDHVIVPKPGQLHRQVTHVKEELGGVKWQLMATDNKELHVGMTWGDEDTLAAYDADPTAATWSQSREHSADFLEAHPEFADTHGITFTLGHFRDMLASDGQISFAVFGNKRNAVRRFSAARKYKEGLPVTFLWHEDLIDRSTFLVSEDLSNSVTGLEETAVVQATGLEALDIVDTYTGMTTTIPSDGLLVDGYSMPGGGIVPDALIEAGLVEPGATRLLVPPAVLNGSQHIYIQAGLLDSGIVEALRVQGVAVTEFFVSDIPTPAADVPSTFIAAVAHGSEAEARMARTSTVVNLYGSSPELRPTTLSSLATLIQVAVDRDGLLRVNAIFVDDVSGAIAIDLYA